jgi:methylmalonyl-CoA mutase
MPSAVAKGQRVFMRSLATRDFGSEISQALPDVLLACKAAGFDLIVVETSGIGQGDAAIVPLVDVPMYVMTPEFGAASQLEKIDMLDFAEFVAINKFDRKGAADALRDVAKQVQRNKEAFKSPPEDHARVRHHGQPLQRRRRHRAVPGAAAAPGSSWACRWATAGCRRWTRATARTRVPIVPGARVRYLADIADTVRGYKRRAREQAALARQVQQLRESARMLHEDDPTRDGARNTVLALAEAREARLDPHAKKLLAMWPDMQKAYAGDEYVVKIRDKEIRTAPDHTTLSGNKIRKVALPRTNAMANC